MRPRMLVALLFVALVVVAHSAAAPPCAVRTLRLAAHGTSDVARYAALALEDALAERGVRLVREGEAADRELVLAIEPVLYHASTRYSFIARVYQPGARGEPTWRWSSAARGRYEAGLDEGIRQITADLLAACAAGRL